MPDCRVLRRIRLSPEHGPTGNTRHYRDGGLLPPPVGLEIAWYPGETGYYLFYLDGSGDVQTDTWHQTLEDAMHQAEFEFRVKPDEWEALSTEAEP